MIDVLLTDYLQFDLAINKRIIEYQSQKNQKSSNKKANIRRGDHRCNYEVYCDEDDQNNEWQGNLEMTIDFSYCFE